MTPMLRKPDNHPNRRRHPAVLALLALLIGGALLAGCGSSSKPAYCDPVNKTEDAVKSLPTAQDVKANGVGTLKSALSTVQQNATTAINQAKSDFSTQTTALKSSVDALANTVKIGEMCDWTYTKVNRCLAEGRARLHRNAEASGVRS